MSRGPGRLQRAIAALFEANPHSTFSTEELVRHVFPGVNCVEKKHRVAALRAADSVCHASAWDGIQAELPGHPVIYYNGLDVHSYAQMKERAKGATIHDKDLLPGGVWWQHVEIYRQFLAGEDTTAARAALRDHV